MAKQYFLPNTGADARGDRPLQEVDGGVPPLPRGAFQDAGRSSGRLGHRPCHQCRFAARGTLSEHLLLCAGQQKTGRCGLYRPFQHVAHLHLFLLAATNIGRNKLRDIF